MKTRDQKSEGRNAQRLYFDFNTINAAVDKLYERDKLAFDTATLGRYELMTL